jgi:hypothetical protein
MPLPEQRGVPFPITKQRASATHTPIHAHRAGHSINRHPEDTSYITDANDDEDDDKYYPTRAASSAVRYRNAQGQDVIQRGRQRFIIHEGPPPKRRMHWSLSIGIGMVLMVLFFVGLSALSSWWTNHQVDATYGYPRTYQVDAVVGHDDSADHPSHFIFLNLSGHVIIIELPGGDVSHAKIYSGPTIFTDDAASVPVTGEFKDVNGDGKIDLIIHIQDQRIIYLNDGSQFKPQS